MRITNPYTGKTVEWDDIPEFDTAAQKPGRFCPSTHQPMDDVALEHFHYAYGNDESNNRLRKTHKDAVDNIKNQLFATVNRTSTTPEITTT